MNLYPNVFTHLPVRYIIIVVLKNIILFSQFFAGDYLVHWCYAWVKLKYRKIFWIGQNNLKSFLEVSFSLFIFLFCIFLFYIFLIQSMIFRLHKSVKMKTRRMYVKHLLVNFYINFLIKVELKDFPLFLKVWFCDVFYYFDIFINIIIDGHARVRRFEIHFLNTFIPTN